MLYDVCLVLYVTKFTVRQSKVIVFNAGKRRGFGDRGNSTRWGNPPKRCLDKTLINVSEEWLVGIFARFI